MPFRDDESSPPRFIARCQLSDLEAYAVDAHRPEPSNPSRAIRVHHTTDGGKTWNPVPMRRALTSYLSMLLRGAEDDWPPPALEELRWDGTRLRLRFRDDVWAQGVPHDHIWDAHYDPRRRTWTIRKVRTVHVDT